MTATVPLLEVAVSKATVQQILEAQAASVGIDSALVKAVAWQESGWQMLTAVDGGMGVMQLMPDTVTWLSHDILNIPINPYDPTQNIHAGAALLSYYLRVFSGNVRLAVAAYHQGQASVQAYGLLPETQRYVSNVLIFRQRFAAQSQPAQ